jgi:hypothetical protein
MSLVAVLRVSDCAAHMEVLLWHMQCFSYSAIVVLFVLRAIEFELSRITNCDL